MRTTSLPPFEDGQEGFTLIELMIVVLIIAILMAIAIPVFLGERTRAQDGAAQTNLRMALTAEKIYYVDNSAYTVTPSSLSAIDGTLTFVPGLTPLSSSILNNIAVSVDVTGTIVCLTATSASGAVFVMADKSAGSSAGTYYFSGRLYTCDGGVSAGARHF
jgi:type IV pilus assembly protein PilA